MGGPGPRGGAILIVEDDADLRRLFSSVLTEAGYSVREAASGEEAIELVRAELPLLVLLDVRLPGVSGYEVCRALRDRSREGLPIVFMSGERKEVFDRAVGLMLGADDYLTKPFSNEELLVSVRALIRRTVPAPRPLGVNLTAREREVLRLLAGGLNQADIAGHLLISGKTVGTHIEHILMKLGVQSRAQAVAVAYRDNLVAQVAAPPSIAMDRPTRSTYDSNVLAPTTLRPAGRSIR